MDNHLYNACILAALWLMYFVVHSVLASVTSKQWVATYMSAVMPFYRLIYNVLAMVLILIPLIYLYTHQTNYLWRWQGAAAWLANGLALVAVLLFFRTLSYYDSKEFLGIQQLQNDVTGVNDQETFRISPFHRYVRHPWYSLALIIIWTRDMDVLILTTAIMMTIYFILGSKLEESKLRLYHGAIYIKYCEKVPSLIPRPWRFLSIEQTKKLMSEYQDQQHN